jgi:hypothetical protein
MSRILLPYRFVAILLVGLVSVAGTARADESYYMIIFGQQDGARQVDSAHTFATFVKARGEGPDRAKYSIESHTISWMPRSLDVKVLKRPEQGINLTLKDTLNHARTIKTGVSMWGPFAIKKELYDRAVRQESRLNKGAIGYKALDLRFRPNDASNCIHAVSDIDTDAGLMETGTAHGDEASFMVLQHLGRWIIDPDQTHEWVSQRLELGKDIVRREYRPKAEIEKK